MKRLLRRATTKLFTRFPSLVDRWLARNPIDVVRDVPFARLDKPLSECRLGIVTTGGVYVDGQLPYDLSDADGDPGWRPLPTSTPRERLRIAHDSYDTTAALLDPNVVHPVDRARQLVEAGRLGGLVDEHVGLNGHIDGAPLTALVERTAPVIAAHFRDQRADIVLLAPA